MRRFITSFIFCAMCLVAFAESATFTVKNLSERALTVKIMKLDGGLYTTIYIPAKSTRTTNISTQGYYYTKTKAEKQWSETIYSKDDAFFVQNNSQGYSVLTVTYWVEESKYPQSSGQRISKTEFENDNK